MDGVASESLAELYRQHRPALVRYLETLLGDRASAEDAAQDAGTRFLTAGRSQSIREPRAFLFHIATNLARDQLRRRLTRQRAEQILMQEAHEAQPSDTVAMAREQIDRVRQALETMPPRPREVIYLARMEGYSHREIAERLGISAKTVENHLTRGLALLAQALAAADGDLGDSGPGSVP